MNKIKWPILGIALLGLAAAYANKPIKVSKQDMHRYSFMNKNQDGSKTYYGMDLTAAEFVKGWDYDCAAPAYTCTFVGNPLQSHSDLTGNWFYTSDLPLPGFDNTGVFILMSDELKKGKPQKH